LNVNDKDAAGLLAVLANTIAMAALINDMDDKGKFLNSAFAVSAGFAFCNHFGFTAAVNKDMILPVSGFSALFLALFLTSKPKNSRLMPKNLKHNIGKNAAFNSYRKPEILSLLIKAGAYVDITDNIGNTALHYAAFHNQYDYRSPALISILLEEQSNINAKNGEGKTALDTAKENNNLQAVKFLTNKLKKK
jgi:hypothetical protein